MPYVAKIKRDDPFRSTDRREIEAMVRRIAAAGEHFSIAGWREEAGFTLFHFSTWAKARNAALDRPQRHRAPADADAFQSSATRCGRVITLSRRRFVTRLGTRASPQRE
jgi:hypothetical protein